MAYDAVIFKQIFFWEFVNCFKVECGLTVNHDVYKPPKKGTHNYSTTVH
jgi:hypothetical protein